METCNAKYIKHGYKDREDYLNNLAIDNDVDLSVVKMFSDMLGETEDFDGLVSELEDYQYLFMRV